MSKEKTNGKRHGHFKLTNEIVTKAKDYAMLGLYKKDICALLKIAYSDWDYWYKKGEAYLASHRAGEEPNRKERLYLAFKHAVDAGEAELEQKLVRIVKTNAENDGHLALQFLRARFPNKYNRKAVDIAPATEAEERAKENPYASDFTDYLNEMGQKQAEEDGLIDPEDLEIDES